MATTRRAPTPCAYLHKLAVGPRARGAIDIADSPENNLRRIAFAMDVQVQDLTVMLLDRRRHQGLLERLRALGSRLVLISDGDIAAALMTAWPGSGVDVLIGSGGTAEAVLAACALRCLGGEMQCRPWVRNQEESAALSAAGIDAEAKLTIEDLVPGRDVAVAVTGVTGGGLVRGVQYHDWWAETHSLVMRAQSGTVRDIRTKHHVALDPRDAHRLVCRRRPGTPISVSAAPRQVAALWGRRSLIRTPLDAAEPLAIRLSSGGVPSRC